MKSTSEDKKPEDIQEVEKYPCSIVSRISLQAKSRLEAIKGKHKCRNSDALEFMIQFQYMFYDEMDAAAKVFFEKGKDYFVSPDGLHEVLESLKIKPKP